MKLKQVLLTALISALTTLTLVWVFGNYYQKKITIAGQVPGATPANYRYAGLNDSNNNNGPGPSDFTQSASAALPAVVHIKTKTNAKTTTNSLPRMRQNPFSDFFDDDMFNQLFGGNRMQYIPEQRASGSGVIISDDGYIVTNNHVVDNADEITVTLNDKKTYKAKVIGTDPSYDLAVIKIETSGLPYLIYGNSDDVKIGQWVLAIGYPLNLETTVTAGIVSAKSRSLGLNKDKSGKNAGVESYIQTDAAVNMGNSGGALINTDGKLIGVNSAIASPTGYYSGYSYAIPVNIVKKVVDDIIKYGTVQRGYLGISFIDAGNLSDEEKKREGIPASAYGIYVNELPTNGGAYAAGLKKGDIIKKINGVEISSGSEMQEQVSRYKPGDKISVTYQRNGKDNTVPVTLKNASGTYDIVKNESSMQKLGADFSNLDQKKAKEYGISGGVVVKKINNGVLNDQTRMKDGFVIVKVNNNSITTTDELQTAIGNNSNITLTGFYPGYDGLYEYSVNLNER